MADEISISVFLRVSNGSHVEEFAPGNISVDQAAIGKGGYVQSIGTAEEVVDFGDIVDGTEGYMVLRNLDTYHYINYGPESSGAMVVFGVLKPGEVALIRVSPGVIMRAQAIAGDTSPAHASLLDVRIYSD